MKDLFCLANLLVLSFVCLVYPGQPGLNAWFLVQAGGIFAIFPFSEKPRRILVHILITVAVSSILQVLFVFDITMPFARIPNPTEEIVIYVFSWVLATIAASAFVFRFNYLHLHATLELEEQKKNQQDILNNIDQGLLTIDNGLKVQTGYSRELTAILEVENPEGVNFYEEVIEKSDISSTIKSQILSTIQMIGEDSLNFHANSHFLPLKLSLNKKVIHMNWAPVEKDDTLDSVMFVMEDISTLESLSKAVKEQGSELKIIDSFLTNEVEGAFEFLGQAKMHIEESLAQCREDKVATIFVTLHTIKGNSRVYKFKQIADLAHETEAYFQRVRSGEKFSEEEARIILQVLKDEIKKHIDVINKYVGPHLKEQEPAKATSLKVTLKPVLSVLQQTCEQVGILEPRVEIEEPNEWLTPNLKDILRDSFSHIINNSVAHGLEPSAERKASGKPENGLIKIKVVPTEKGYSISYHDDGRGLNLNALRKKSKMDASVSDIQIAETIFASGVSTTENVNNLSGRGVGMDAVRAFLTKAGARINIEFNGEKSANGFQPFRFVIFF